MNSRFHEFASILSTGSVAPSDPRLLLDRTGDLEIYYAPFDAVNASAKLVLVGITPGEFQARKALDKATEELQRGVSIEAAMQSAKRTASFSGPMRSNLVKMLDYFNLDTWLGVSTCASLFEEHNDLVHYTSALRYPVFVNGKNYSGTPDIIRTDLLRHHMETYFGEEVRTLTSAVFIPLGKAPAKALEYLVHKDVLSSDRVLSGIPHPSGANAERIKYIVGEKPASELSVKTRADTLDLARDKVRQQVEALLSIR